MRNWYYGINNHPEFKIGTLYLVQEPWYWALVGACIDRIMFPRILQYLYMPKGRRKQRDPSDPTEDTFRDYWGDWSCVWHHYVSNPLFQWSWKHRVHYEISLELGYDKLKGLLYETHAKEFDQYEDTHV